MNSAAILVGVLLFGCLVVACGLVLIAAAIFDLRKNGSTMAMRLEQHATKNHEAIMRTELAVVRVETMLEAYLKARTLTPDPDA